MKESLAAKIATSLAETPLPGHASAERATHARLCRFCATPLQHSFADLGMSPLSNAYLYPDQLNSAERFYPLHAYVCATCLLVQVEVFETADRIFDNYAYFSSYSDTWVAHARRFAEMTIARFGLSANSFVVEVASNDGYLLHHFVERKVPVLGIEPAATVAAAAEAKCVPTLVKFFGRDTARALVSEGKQADLIVANNVAAHVPDIIDFVAGFKCLLKPTGVATFEFHHVLKLIEENQFDTIYHEHFYYHSLTTFRRILDYHGLAVFDVEELPTHGGSLRVYAQHAEYAPHPMSARVGDLLAREAALGLTRLETYLAFGERVERTKYRLLSFLLQVKAGGKTMVGYGAPAKGNTLLNYAGIRTDLMRYTVDRSPHKQGRYLPGSHIPILSPEAIAETKPDYVLILPWNLKDEIMEQMAYIREWGGQFLVLIPDVQVF